MNRPNFGDQVRAYRIAAGLSQEELAARSGLGAHAISNLERGRTRWPHPGSVLRLADAFRLTGQARAEFVSTADRRLPHSVPASAVPADTNRIVPRQLPSAVPAFAGRTTELATLTGVLARPGGTAVITAIGGTAGVGKTALALHWGHRAAAEFPDGQLYVNLQGFGPSDTPVAPGSAIRVLLEGLGVSAERLPHTDDGQLTLYRSLLAGKHMLIVLDNAHDEAQVRPLLPGSLTCRVVVTSRNLLTELIALDAAHPLQLDVLTESEAWDLLERRLGAERLHADEAAARQLIKACANLPLALAIIAAHAALRPDLSIGDIAADLAANQRLDAFTAGEPAADIRTVLSWSFRQLDDDTARAFRLTGLHPGPSLDQYAAAALTGTTLDQTKPALRTLTQGCLIQQAAPDRYTMHDLLREYARELSAAHDSEADRRTALTALFDYYLHAAYAASVLMFPAASPRPPRVPAPAIALPSLADYAEAREWLDGELANLVAISGYAAGNGWLAHAAEMSPVLYSYLHVGHHYAEGITIHQRALNAATRAGDHSAQGTALCGLAVIDHRRGWLLNSLEHYQQAFARYQEAGDKAGQIRAGQSLSAVLQTQGRFREAAPHLRAAIAFYRAAGDQVGEVRALFDFGFLHLRLGRYRQAARCLRDALTLYQETGDQRFKAQLLMRMGFVDFRLSHFREAAMHWQEALGIMQERRDPGGEADLLRLLGTASLRQGDHEQAVSYLQAALALSHEMGARHAEAEAQGYLGLARLRQGHHQAALGDLEQALKLARDLQDPEVTASVLNSAGEALVAVGQPALGQERHAEALTVAAGGGDRYEMARAQAGLGSAYDALGDRAEASHHWRLAHDAYAKMGMPEAADIRRRLDL